MKKKVAVILAGSGVYDGSEVHESTLSLYSLSKNGIDYQCFAPNIMQKHVINHLNGQESEGDKRNVLTESARIARGDVKELAALKTEDYDALLIPGGFGAAKNLCSFAFDGESMQVLPELESVILNMHTAGKPIVALCIAPVILAKVLKAKVTIGNDTGTAQAIEKMGGEHQNTRVDEISIDEENKIITTACYMLAKNPLEVGVGAELAVQAMKGMMG